MKLNKNYAGISFLYRKNGAVSTVMEIVMKEEVNGPMLQASVYFTLSRHPYFKSSLQERGGDYYIAENETPLKVENTLNIRGRSINIKTAQKTHFRDFLTGPGTGRIWLCFSSLWEEKLMFASVVPSAATVQRTIAFRPPNLLELFLQKKHTVWCAFLFIISVHFRYHFTALFSVCKNKKIQIFVRKFRQHTLTHD